MSQGMRLSAIAKRRKIEHDVVSSTTPTPEAEVLRSGVSLGAVQDVAEAIEAQDSRAKSRARRKKTQQSVIQTLDAQNPFALLAQDPAVQSRGTREIDQLSPTSIKVRLSHGSCCTFSGEAKLWVRDGTLSVYGAVLQASPTLYDLSASEWSSLPLLTATSKTVEFQLESRDFAREPKQSSELPGMETTTAQHSKQTFSVTSQDKIALLPLDISGLEDLPQSVLNGSVVNADNILGLPNSPKPAAIRFFIAGKRSNSTAVATIVLTNLLLSEQLRSGRSACVVTLDLDYINPLQSVPGTIGLALVKQFLLSGPNLYDNHNNGLTLLRSVWMSATDATKFDQVGEEALLDMLKDDRIPMNAPIIVRGGSWMIPATGEHTWRFARELGNTKFIYVDSTQSSQYFQSCKKLAELLGQEMDIRPVYFETSLSTNAELKACLRAHLRKDKLDHIHELSYFGDGRTLDFFALQGGSLRPIDVLEVLTDALVAVVLVKDKNKGEPRIEHDTKERAPVATIGAEQSQVPVPISPRNIIGATCLGLGVVKSIDISASKIRLAMEIGSQDLTRARQAGQQIGLVLEKPSEDGRFSRDNLKGQG